MHSVRLTARFVIFIVVPSLYIMFYGTQIIPFAFIVMDALNEVNLIVE